MSKKWKILIPIGIIAIIIVYDTLDSKWRIRTDNKITELIEKGDYIQARKLAAKRQSYDADHRVTNAQVLDLINQGRFDLASDIAKEDEYYISFYNGLIDHLSKLYNEYGGEKVIYALSIINYPDTKEKYLPSFWGISYQDNSTGIINRNNKNIESFCDYLKQIGDKQFIPKFLDYLKPIYIEEKHHWDNKLQKEIIDKEAFMDYTEVKRIMAKYGYK